MKFIDILRWALANQALIIEIINLFRSLSPEQQQQVMGIAATASGQTEDEVDAEIKLIERLVS